LAACVFKINNFPRAGGRSSPTCATFLEEVI
jgi:hypothetical protein